VFLFDEPLSNLDAKLRGEMRVELARIHQRLNNTIIYVTHDQVEAMTLGSRIVVLNEGYIQQLGTPAEVYRKPANQFVAGFIGSPTMNFMSGVLHRVGGGLVFDSGDVKLEVPSSFEFPGGDPDGQVVTLAIRPEDVYTEEKAKPNLSMRMLFTVDVTELLGHRKNVYLKLGEKRLLATVAADAELQSGATIPIWFDLERIHLFDGTSGKRLTT